MIVNNTSDKSVTSVTNSPWQSGYSASKAAMAMFSDAQRLELAPFGIRVVELKTRTVRSNLLKNNPETPDAALPKDSIYRATREAIEKVMSGEKFAAAGRLEGRAGGAAAAHDGYAVRDDGRDAQEGGGYRCLLQSYLTEPDHIVIAANRDPVHPQSQALIDLPKGPGSQLILVEVDPTVESDASGAVKDLVAQGINNLDVVVANAGVSLCHPKLSDLNMADAMAHFVPNVIGVVCLYQARLPPVLKSTDPIWVTMGSSAGTLQASSLSLFMPWGFRRRQTNTEVNFPEITAFVVDPGFVATESAPVDNADACNGVVALIDGATKETHGGKFMSYQGTELPW
ncbi:hypothetical protein DL767_003515 [Monosporascus sp. MG133]|nr:hypothetical protein DL767_003515 [Monosporascus sp. MG133]